MHANVLILPTKDIVNVILFMSDIGSRDSAEFWPPFTSSSGLLIQDVEFSLRLLLWFASA